MMPRVQASLALAVFRRRLLRQVAFRCAMLLTAIALLPAHAQFANQHGVAVIIGNQSYAVEGVPEATYAHRDAEAFRRYVLDVLGFNPDNVLDLRDATRAEMETIFGTERDHQGTVWRYLHPREGSDVVVFYSGHGVPGPRDGRAYVLPVDADPDTAERGGYLLAQLYTNLGKLKEANSVRVFLEASFSGGSDRGMLVQAASPVAVPTAPPSPAGDGLTVFTAASDDEVASWDNEARQGLFTRHLLDALHGAADANGDAQVTAAEVKTYLDNTMTLAARRAFGRRQNASHFGSTDLVLARTGSEGRPPPRPAPGDPEEQTGGQAETTVSAPTMSPEAVEDSLALTPSQKAQVQKGLNALGFDVGAADGKFGPRTRAGIASWQSSRSRPATGYLDAEEVTVLIAAPEESPPAKPEDAEAASAMQAVNEAIGRKDYARALELVRPLASQGYPAAQVIVGRFYLFGTIVAEDPEEGIRWVRLAANQGYAEAQHLMGRLYFSGGGVTENHEEGARWFRLAAEQGSVKSQTLLGQLHFVGDGVPEDPIRSLAWFIVAAAQGDEEARGYVDRLFDEALTPTQVSQARKLSREIAERIGVELVSVSNGVPETPSEEAPPAEPQRVVPEEALATLDEALSVVQRISEDWQRVFALGDIAEVQVEAGDTQGAARTVSEALSIARRISRDWMRGMALGRIASAQAKAGDIQSAARTISEAQSTARSTKHDWERASVYIYIAQAQAAIGDVKDALSTARRLDEDWRPRTLGHIAQVQVQAGDTQGAARTVSEALSIARKLDEDWRRGAALGYIAQVQVRAGDTQGAARAVSEALSIARKLGEDWQRNWAYAEIAKAQAAIGDIEEALSTTQSITDTDARDEALSGIVEWQAAAGDIQRALSLAQSIGDDNRAFALSHIARAQITASKADRQ